MTDSVTEQTTTKHDDHDDDDDDDSKNNITYIRGLSKKKPNFLFKTFIDKLTTE
jgi:hypothetical protein